MPTEKLGNKIEEKKARNSVAEEKNLFGESLTQNGVIKTPTSEAAALKWNCRSLFAY